MSERQIFAVSELTEMLRGLLDDSLPRLWVQGEISNFSRPASGHWYFTLKDGSAQMRCALFKPRTFGLKAPRDGDAVLVRGQVTLYPARGDLQLLCEHLEPVGEGALLAATEQLKKKLAGEGLFDARRKRALPPLPRHIGVITSATGAAVQDIRATLARRWPLATLWLAPVAVQGSEAPAAIRKALHELPALAPLDVLILARGGGSLEDLAAFNDEAVVRAVAACPVPVVTGVGHETDTTLVDFAADVRAPTPTAAAERVSPDRQDLLAALRGTTQRLGESLRQCWSQHRTRHRQLNARLHSQHPERRLHDKAQRLDDLHARLAASGGREPLRARAAQQALHARLKAQTPTLLRLNERIQSLQQRLAAAVALHQQAPRHRWVQQSARLGSLNPQAVLQRGYAWASLADGRVLTEAGQVQPGDRVHLQLAQGRLQTVVATAPQPTDGQ